MICNKYIVVLSGEGSSSDPCSQIYRGSRPFSEPETEAVREFVLSLTPNILVYLSVHSYGQHVLIPWGFDDLYPYDYYDMVKCRLYLSLGYMVISVSD